jgi:hypothetical protein
MQSATAAAVGPLDSQLAKTGRKRRSGAEGSSKASFELRKKQPFQCRALKTFLEVFP